MPALASRVALVALALGLLLPATAARSADRVQRQRAGGYRPSTGGWHRDGGCSAEATFPDPTLDLQLPGQGVRGEILSSRAPAPGGPPPVVSCGPGTVERHPEHPATLPDELWALALRARPQAPTFGRPPPL